MFNSIKWLHKEKNDENNTSLGEQSESVKEEINQSSKHNIESKVSSNSSRLINSSNNTDIFEIKNITYNNYTNDILDIKLQYPSNWYLTREDNRVNSSCMDRICNVFFL